MTSLRQAINTKCKECIFDPGSPGTWRQQVSFCTSFNCPLYEVRPKTVIPKNKGKPVEKRIESAELGTVPLPNCHVHKTGPKKGEKSPFMSS